MEVVSSVLDLINEFNQNQHYLYQLAQDVLADISSLLPVGNINDDADVPFEYIAGENGFKTENHTI